MSLVFDAIKPPLRIIPDEPISVEDFWRLSAEHPDLRMELGPQGDIRVMTPTKRNTGSKNLYISRMLGNWADSDGRGEGFDSSTGFELHDGSVLSPDCSWVSFPRLAAAEQDGVELPLCPEFVLELRSASDRLPALREKMNLWIAHGVELAWLIDPSRKAVEIYRVGQGVDIQEGHSAVYGEGPVAGFVLELGRIWG
jgi:Uma2 family endonuclease